MRPSLPRPGFWLAAAAVAGLHLLLVSYFVTLPAVFGPEPLAGDDFDLHIGQVFRVVEGLHGWGKSWVYDVELLAGQPEGTITDAGSKGWELWTYAVTELGASRAAAFNSFVLFVIAAVPFVVFAAAWLFGLSPWASLLAAALGSCLWFFDSFVHWAWWVGMVSYAFVAYANLLPLALFYRFMQTRRPWTAAACAPLLGLAHLIHPYSFFVLAPPMAALYARGFRRLPRSGHLAVLAIGAVTLAINLFWLRVSLAHWHYILDSAFYAQADPSYLIADFLNLMVNPADTGVIGTRSGFRFLALALAAAGLWSWRRQRDPRCLPFTVALISLIVLAYFGGYIPGAAQIQPYRHMLPATLFACVPAAGFVEWLVAERVLSGLQRGAQLLLGVLSLLLVQHLSIQVAYFLPELIAESAAFPDGTPTPISKYGHLLLAPGPTHVFYGLPHDPFLEPGFDEVLTWVDKHVPAGARLLVDQTVLGERIAWKTHAEVMGGFLERNTDHAYANFFRRYGERKLVAKPELARYLRTFGIAYVILQRPRADLQHATELLQELPPVGGRLVYRTRFPVSTLLQGGGSLRARTNRIELRGTDRGKDVVVSYHWHEALRCEPGCRVVRQRVELDRVGLIRVPAPHPQDFAIVNRYR